MEGLRDVGCTVQTAAEYAQKTGCGREECKAQSVGNTHGDDANGEFVSKIFMRVRLTSRSHCDANTNTLNVLTSHSHCNANTHITITSHEADTHALTLTLTLTTHSHNDANTHTHTNTLTLTLTLTKR